MKQRGLQETRDLKEGGTTRLMCVRQRGRRVKLPRTGGKKIVIDARHQSHLGHSGSSRKRNSDSQVEKKDT